MEKKVVILGNSFARRIQERIANPNKAIAVPHNLGCTREEVHFCIRLERCVDQDYWIPVPRQEPYKSVTNYSTIDLALKHWEDIYRQWGNATS